MRNAKLTLWGFLALLTLAWLLAEAAALPPQTLFAWRAAMLQLTGLLAIGLHGGDDAGAAPDWPSGQRAYLYHTTAEVDEAALESLAAEADARLHILVDARDGRLTGERIREQVPDWAEASVWFCGPAAFGAALRRDFAAKGFPVQRRFHQELFATR